MALLIRVWAKAQVWVLARRDAHSLLAVWAISSIVGGLVRNEQLGGWAHVRSGPGG